jgi:hypothetical protein
MGSCTSLQGRATKLLLLTPTHPNRIKRNPQNTRNPEKTDSNSVGWVGGVTPKPSVPNCPAGLSKQTCDLCLGSKSPSTCFACVQKPQVYYGSARACAACSDLTDSTQRDTCASCVADLSPSKGCSTCLFYDRSGQRLDPEKSSKCFSCVVAAGKDSRESNACTTCFLAPSATGNIDTDSCLKCASDPKHSEATRAGCAGGLMKTRAWLLVCAWSTLGCELGAVKTMSHSTSRNRTHPIRISMYQTSKT